MLRFGFYKWYFVATVFLFITEVLIAAYMHDALIRPYGGDLLVVILIYCFVNGFYNAPLWPAAIGVLVFAYVIEVSQYFHLVYALGWGDSKLARVVMGTGFSWIDMLMYTLGILLVVIFEKTRLNYGKAIKR